MSVPFSLVPKQLTDAREETMKNRRSGHVLVTLSLAAFVAAGAAACTSTSSTSSTDPSTSPSTSDPVATSGPAHTTLDGTAYFAKSETGGTQVYSVVNKMPTKLVRIPRAADDQCVDNTVIVSPDGQWVAYAITNGDDSAVQGTVTVSRLDGSSPRTQADVYCSLNENSWTKDNHLLVVKPGGSGEQLSIDPATGTTTTVPAATDAASSHNGAFLAKRATGGGFTIEAADGRVVRTVKDYKNDFGGFSTCGFSLKGVSDDGRFVTIGHCATDPDRVLGARYLYDVEAGRHVTLPAKGIDAIMFVDNTTVVLHGSDEAGVRSLMLVSVAGKVITTLPDASATFGTTFIGYTPAS